MEKAKMSISPMLALAYLAINIINKSFIKSSPERLLRERAIFKVHSDFVSAATRGAMAVIDGNVMAINPGEDPKMQMFIWNNIFFSLGFDVRDHYKDLGGDAAAYVAPKNDLQGVKVFNAVDLEGLYTLGTVVIDYRGYRVTAQSIIPGVSLLISVFSLCPLRLAIIRMMIIAEKLVCLAS
jgi:hypothetical protein